MIITITLNPAVDHTLVLSELVPNAINRVVDSRIDPGGKGINVSRMLMELGAVSVATGFVSGATGRYVESSLNMLGIEDDFVRTAGQTRTNFTLMDRLHHSHTSIHNRGPDTDPAAVEELYRKLSLHVHSGDWVILGGSIPPGIPTDIYAQLITFLKKRGARTVLDADGEALAAGIAAGPYMIKPNQRELERLTGEEMLGETSILRAAQGIHNSGVELVVVSYAEQGCYAESNEGRWRAIPPLVDHVSTVGAGDALVAGIVYTLSRNGSLEEALQLGTAAACASALTPGTQLCRRSDVNLRLRQVIVLRLDADAVAGVAPAATPALIP